MVSIFGPQSVFEVVFGIVPEGVDVMVGETAGYNLVMGDIADFHIVIDFQWDGDNLIAVEFGIEDTTADGIAIQPDEQVE